MPRTTKPAKASTSAVEKIQDESSSHEESSSSDQQQDQEDFIKPLKTQLLPNMIMPYIEGPKVDWTVKESDYMEWSFWEGLVCFLELFHR